MASYAVAATEVGAWEKTLVASTVDTVTFTGDRSEIEVLNESTSTGLYFTVDGTTPTVGSNDAFYVPPTGVREVPSREGGDTIVKIISSGTPKYSASEVVS